MINPAIQHTRARMARIEKRLDMWKGITAACVMISLMGTGLILFMQSQNDNATTLGNIFSLFCAGGYLTGFCCLSTPFIGLSIVMLWRNTVELSTETRHLESLM